MGLPQGWRNYFPFLWHGFFLAITTSMIDLNTVLPSLLSTLTSNTLYVGAIFSLMIGAPLLFNLPFGRFQNRFERKRPFLLIGIYLRGLSFFGIAFALLWWGKDQPLLALALSAFFMLVFSAGGGFAGIAYTGLVGQVFPSEKRGQLYASRQIFSGIAALVAGVFLFWLFKPGNQPFPLNYSIALFIGGSALLLGAIGFWVLREPSGPANPSAAQPAKPRGTWAVLKKDPALRRFILVENLSGFSLMLLPFYILFIKAEFADFGAWVGAFVLAQTAGAIGSNFIWAMIFRRAGPRMVARLCMVSGGLVPLLALAIQPFGIAAYVGLFFVIGFVISGRNIGFEPWLLEIAPADERTIYLGIRGSLSLLIAVLPLLGGFFILNIGYAASFIAVAIFMVASASLIPRMKSG